MPEKEKVDDENMASPTKKPFPKLIIFLVIGMIVIAIISFVVVRFVFAPAPSQEEGQGTQAEEKKFYGYLFSFDEAIIVNLAETNGQRYLKVNLQLEMSAEELREELTARRAQLLDLIISILSSKTIDEVSSTIGRNRLKREIIDKLNAEIVTGKMVNIYFTEFVIQ